MQIKTIDNYRCKQYKSIKIEVKLISDPEIIIYNGVFSQTGMADFIIRFLGSNNNEICSFFIKETTFIQKIIFFKEDGGDMEPVPVSLDLLKKPTTSLKNMKYNYNVGYIFARNNDGCLLFDAIKNNIVICILKNSNLNQIVDGFIVDLDTNTIVHLKEKEIIELRLYDFSSITNKLSELKEKFKENPSKNISLDAFSQEKIDLIVLSKIKNK